jgi:hypothetical protein
MLDRWSSPVQRRSTPRPKLDREVAPNLITVVQPVWGGLVGSIDQPVEPFEGVGRPALSASAQLPLFHRPLGRPLPAGTRGWSGL